MSLYEVVVRGSLFSQRVINRFNYVGAGDIGTSLPSFGLLVKMGFLLDAGVFPAGTLAANWAGNVSSSFEFLAVQAKNIYDPTDFYEVLYAPVILGDETGDAMPPYVAYGFTSNQVTLAVRKGHKRLAGVTEGDGGADGIIGSGFMVNLASIATEMSRVLIYTDDDAALSFSPAVVSKEKYLSHTAPDRYSYRYYADEAVQATHTASPVVFSAINVLRSQVSRQYGSGE